MIKKPLIIAHRGFSGKYPENTILSVSEAVISGADIIEVDLQLTKDNNVVLFHDQNVERILIHEKNKAIGDYSLEELKKKDFGSWLDKKYSECRVTTLSEILDFKSNCKKPFDYILEVKDKNPESLIPKIKALLDNFNFRFNIGYLSVRDEITFKIAIEQGFEKKNIGIMQKKRTPKEIISLALDLKAKIIQVRPNTWSDEDWTLLQKSELKYTIFYADSNLEYQKYYKLSPYGIFTNYPNLLKDFFEI